METLFATAWLKPASSSTTACGANSTIEDTIKAKTVAQICGIPYSAMSKLNPTIAANAVRNMKKRLKVAPSINSTSREVSLFKVRWLLTVTFIAAMANAKNTSERSSATSVTKTSAALKSSLTLPKRRNVPLRATKLGRSKDNGNAIKSGMLNETMSFEFLEYASTAWDRMSIKPAMPCFAFSYRFFN